MTQITQKHYQLIYADPPWKFLVHSDKGKDRSAENHYDVMTLDDIKNLPVSCISADDSVLLMWVTDPFLKKGLEVMEAWGFEYRTKMFHWAKQCPKSDKWWMGNGYYTRANGEDCLLGVKYRTTRSGLLRPGKGLKRFDKSVRRLIVSHVREHSRKPDEAYERIERLFGGVSKIELFARRCREGWDSWGNEVGGDMSFWNLQLENRR